MIRRPMMATNEPKVAALRHRVYEIMDGLAERIPLSFAIYEPGAVWPKLYRDAEPDTLCGFARRANPTSGRCRDEENRMAAQVLDSGRAGRSCCWQGTMRGVVPVMLDGVPVLAVAVCGFGVDPEARRNDYLPQEMAQALGLQGPSPQRAFPGDAGLSPEVADGLFYLIGLALGAAAANLD